MSFKNYQIVDSPRPLSILKHWDDESYLELNPTYQRGDVWSEERQRNLIKSFLMRIPIPSIIVNDRFKANWSSDGWGDDSICYAVIDGKQRITSFLKFLRGDLPIPKSWVGIEGSGDIVFSDLPVATKRSIHNKTIGVCEASLPDIESEEEVFNLVNFGGVPQGESDFK